MHLTCAYYGLRIALTYGTPLSFVLFLQILIMLLRPDIVDQKHRPRIVPHEEILYKYDYIIIGGGSAGSVLANRLTENSDLRVLVLEAGSEQSVISEITALMPALQMTNEDWQFKTEPSSISCLGMNNNQCTWPRGKALGGSSAINLMMYVRGNRRDYDGWRDLGNPGWGYSDVLPYFIKSENMTLPNLLNSPYHGTAGPLTVEQIRDDSPLPRYLLNAGRDLGYPILDDQNGATQMGFSIGHSTVRNGLRCSTAKAYLGPASDRKNLHVSTHSYVEQILVDEVTKAAYGVLFRRDGEKYVVRAGREVILSAGAIKSPQLLMLSGIGPKKHLEEIGIQLIHDSPGVGQNLQDHVSVAGATFLYASPSSSPEPSEPVSEGSSVITVSAAEEFLENKTGPLYYNPPNGVQAFVPSKYADHPDYPDIQLVFAEAGFNGGGGFFTKRNYGLRDELFDSVYGGILNNSTWGPLIICLHPKSRGYIKLKDADPNHDPLIMANYLEHPHDVKVLVEGLKIVYNISQTPSLQELNSRPNPNLIPVCAHHFAHSLDDYFECWARQFTVTAYHPTCTCKMGLANDDEAVVDSRLRVYGVKRLRVVDASIMPKITSGNTNAPTVMIAEKAADMIKEDYNDL